MHDFTHPQLAVVMRKRADDDLLVTLEDLGEDVSVEVVEGDVGVRHLDVDGSEHGLMASLKRAIQEEQRPIGRLVDALEDGHSVLFVHNVGDDLRETAVAALDGAPVEFMYHFGDSTWQRLGETS